MRTTIAALAIALTTASATVADDTPRPIESPTFLERLFLSNPPRPAVPQVPLGRKHLVIICGLSGGDEFRQRFTLTIDTIVAALTERGGFDPGLVQLYLGDPQMLEETEAEPYLKEEANRETLRSLAASLQETVQPQDTLWLMVMGHSYYDGRNVWLNLPDRDMDVREFGDWFAEIGGRESTFWITVPASGFFIRPLSKPGRIVISATEADREVVATEFPHMLADVLTNPPDADNRDPDGDGRLSLLDVYLMTTRRVAESFVERELWATEHAHLDDNGDRRGSEVQRSFLPEELEGRLADGEQPRPRTGDREGAVAASVLLPTGLLPAAVTEEVVPPEETAEESSDSEKAPANNE